LALELFLGAFLFSSSYEFIDVLIDLVNFPNHIKNFGGVSGVLNLFCDYIDPFRAYHTGKHIGFPVICQGFSPGAGSLKWCFK